MPAPLTSFDGVSNVNGVHPPDTQGDIGYDPATGTKYYVQWVNLSFAVWDVTGTPTKIYGPVNGNTLWQGFGGACETTNHGDPITPDPLAHRWLMSQFSVNGPYYQCIAISQTADPTGPWYRYAFLVSSTKMNDYPKFGVWPDGYMTVNQFTNGSSWGGAGVFVFERAKLLASAILPRRSSILICTTSIPTSAGCSLRPRRFHAAARGRAQLLHEVGRQHVDRTERRHAHLEIPRGLGQSQQHDLGLNGQPNAVLNTATWTPLCTSTRACIPQPGTSVKLDAIGDRLMYRLAYRNFGDHEALVVNHTVDAGSGLAGVLVRGSRPPAGRRRSTNRARMLRIPITAGWAVVAMDAQGNLALATACPAAASIPPCAAGRLANDPLGTLPQAETSLVVGSGYQTSGYNRWGDYSMMGIDPVDDCTFWYTQEYLASGAALRTRIGSFRFPSSHGRRTRHLARRRAECRNP